MNALILKKGREKSLRRRHPWIFSGAVEKAGGKPGETLQVRDIAGNPIALAAYSPSSQIRARVWTFDVSASIDNAFSTKESRRPFAFANSFLHRSTPMRCGW